MRVFSALALLALFSSAFAATAGVNLSVYEALDTQAPKWFSQGQDTGAPAYQGAVRLSVLWTDNRNLSSFVLETNESGVWVGWPSDYEPLIMPLSGASDWGNFTWSNASVAIGTVVCWRMWANDSSDNWNNTDDLCFTVTAAAPTASPSSGPSNTGYYGGTGTGCLGCVAESPTPTAEAGLPPLVTPTPVAARPRAVIGAPSLALTGDTVSVRVVGESGVPLAGVSVLVVPPTGAEFEAGPTDSSGVVEVKVSGPGLYLFRPLAGYDALEASMLAVTRPPSLVEEAVGAVQAAAVPLGVDWTQLALIGAAGVALALFALSRKRRGDDDEKRQENIREILQEVRQKRLSEGDDAKGGLE